MSIVNYKQQHFDSIIGCIYYTAKFWWRLNSKIVWMVCRFSHCLLEYIWV